MMWYKQMYTRRAKALLRRAAFGGTERTWTMGMRLTSTTLGWKRTVRPWAPGPGRVVIVATHPDDETLGAGGTAALHAQAGDRVTIVVVTDGRGSGAGGLSPGEMATRRRREAQRAAEALHAADLVQLALPEECWEVSHALSPLASVLETAHIIYTPSCVDFHPEHLRVARLVGKVLDRDEDLHAHLTSQWVRIYELGVPLTPLLTNLVADVGPVRESRARALAGYETQRDALIPLARLARYRAAMYGFEAAEAFWELPAPAFARIMGWGDWDWYDSPFRGIRPRPFSDPLAFLAGWRTRLCLRRMAEQPLNSHAQPVTRGTPPR